jgi:hypothetical protein
MFPLNSRKGEVVEGQGLEANVHPPQQGESLVDATAAVIEGKVLPQLYAFHKTENIEYLVLPEGESQ